MRTQYDEADVRRVFEKMATKIAGSFSPNQPLSVVGIRTRGETLAERLSEFLGKKGFKQIGRGVLHITLYSDDL